MEELLRHFARSQMDEVPGIRTNTTICLGRLADHLDASVRLPCARVCAMSDGLIGRIADTETPQCVLALFLQAKKRVLIPAFTRALKDPFPYARLAGLQALQGKHAMHREEAGAQTEGRPNGRARILTHPRPHLHPRPVPSSLPGLSFPPPPTSRLRFAALVKQRPRTTTRRRTSPSE